MAEDASADAVPAHGQAAGGKTLAMPPPVAKDLPMDPPPGKKLSASKSGREDNTRQAAMSAAAEAASAAAHVTPAQRERAIAEAAAKAIAEQQAQADVPLEPKKNQPARTAGTYTPPDWSGMPEGVTYTVETMKNGSIVEQRDINQKSHYIFGRTDACDFQLEHPSISRVHAVLQLSSNGEAFLYDAGSAHGTFLNKQKLKPQVHVPLRVGDVIKFGLSTRLYLFGGPEELRPAEGLTKVQKRQLAALEAKEQRQAKEAQMAKAQMDAARRGGVSWGMAEEAALDDNPDDVTEVDWRLYSQSHTLTDKQQKLADKIRRQELKIHNLRTETDRIRAKQNDAQELTSGQASTMARNEQVVDVFTEEVDDLDEVLNESIMDSIVGKRRAAEAHTKRKRKRRTDDDDDDDEDMGDADDAFYDRTEGSQRRKKAVEVEALDAATLLGQKEALKTEQVRLQAALAEEERRAGTGQQAAGEQPDRQAGGEDELDAFMGQVAVQLEQDKVGALRKEIAEVEDKMREAERLLKVADPDGYFKAGSRAAEAAKAKAQKAMQLEKQQKEAQARRQKEQLAAQKLEQEVFVPEEEEAQPEEAPTGLQIPAQAHPTAASAVPQAEAPATDAVQTGMQSNSGSVTDAAVQPAQEPQGLQIMRPPAAVQRSSKPSRQEIAARLAAKKGKPADSKATQQDIQAKVTADLAALAGRSNRFEDEGMQDVSVTMQHGEWKPPQGQRGDGKTSLNDKLGY